MLMIDTWLCAMLIYWRFSIIHTFTTQIHRLLQFCVCYTFEAHMSAGSNFAQRDGGHQAECDDQLHDSTSKLSKCTRLAVK